MELLLPPRNNHTPLSYDLPNMYKSSFPLHPIFSRCDGPTDHLSSYITHFIQSLANNLPWHIKDKKHFLNLIEKLPPLKQLQFTSRRNKNISYPQIVHLLI